MKPFESLQRGPIRGAKLSVPASSAARPHSLLSLPTKGPSGAVSPLSTSAHSPAKGGKGPMKAAQGATRPIKNGARSVLATPPSPIESSIHSSIQESAIMTSPPRAHVRSRISPPRGRNSPPLSPSKHMIGVYIAPTPLEDMPPEPAEPPVYDGALVREYMPEKPKKPTGDGGETSPGAPSETPGRTAAPGSAASPEKHGNKAVIEVPTFSVLNTEFLQPHTALRIPPGVEIFTHHVVKVSPFDPQQWALSFEVSPTNPYMFAEPPSLSVETGALTLIPTGSQNGPVTLVIRLVDYANFTPSGKFVSSPEVYLYIDVAPMPIAVRKVRDWRSHAAKAKAPRVVSEEPQVAEDPVDVVIRSELKGRDMKLPQPSIHQRVSDSINCSTRTTIALKLLYHPLIFVRMAAHAAERDILSTSTTTVDDAPFAMEQIRESLEQSSNIEKVAPLLEQLMKLHFKIGGRDNINAAKKLCRMRIASVASMLGLPDPVAVATSPRPTHLHDKITSARGIHVQLYIRALVEGAHMMKHTGELFEALTLYRHAAEIVPLVHKTNALSIVPFLTATGDVQLMQGNYTSALETFERCRAIIDANGKAGSSIASEAAANVSLALALCGEGDLHRSNNRKDLPMKAQGHLSGAEGITWQTELRMLRTHVCLLNEAYNQAQQCAIVNVDEAEACDGASVATIAALAQYGLVLLLRGQSTEASDVLEKANTLASRARGSNSPEACLTNAMLLSCEVDTPNKKFNSFPATVEALCAVCGDQALYAPIIRCAYSASLLRDGQQESVDEARNHIALCIQQEVNNLDPTHPAQLATLETAALVAMHLDSTKDALPYLERLVWILQHTPKLKIDKVHVIRICASIARAYAGAGSPVEPHIVEVVEKYFKDHVELLGIHNPAIVPLAIDAAELRYLRGEYEGALALFTQALRIVDSRNILFLLGSLFKPELLLTHNEAAERNRLAAERIATSSGGSTGGVAIALLLIQIGMVHEIQGHVDAATASFQQSVAAFEIAKRTDHIGMIVALSSVCRVLLAQGELGDALVYAEAADNYLLEYHREADAKDRDAVSSCEQMQHVVRSSLWASGYTLIPHVEQPPSFTAVIHI